MLYTVTPGCSEPECNKDSDTVKNLFSPKYAPLYFHDVDIVKYGYNEAIIRVPRISLQPCSTVLSQNTDLTTIKISNVIYLFMFVSNFNSSVKCYIQVTIRH